MVTVAVESIITATRRYCHQSCLLVDWLVGSFVRDSSAIGLPAMRSKDVSFAR